MSDKTRFLKIISKEGTKFNNEISKIFLKVKKITVILRKRKVTPSELRKVEKVTGEVLLVFAILMSILGSIIVAMESHKSTRLNATQRRTLTKIINGLKKNYKKFEKIATVFLEDLMKIPGVAESTFVHNILGLGRATRTHARSGVHNIEKMFARMTKLNDIIAVTSIKAIKG